MRQQPTGTTTQASPQTARPDGGLGKSAIVWVHPSVRSSDLRRVQQLGREESCDIVLAGNEVSRLHASISADGPLPILRDLDSRNGVFVNGERVRERVLGPQDTVRIGEWVGVVVERADDEPTTTELWEAIPGWYAASSLRRTLEPLERVARSDLPIVVQGETGAGKEGIARYVHAVSARSGPFVALDCGTLPEAMVESQLFGYRKGAFTGAERAHLGLFRAAAGGTLFLDEVLNLTLPLQAKLLRVLEQREVLPLGETQPVPVDVRVVCAAQESLSAAASAGTFRRDLVARLEGYTFHMPPLRARKEDVVPLLRRMLVERGSSLVCDVRFAESLLLHDWPLNVRELALCARRLIALDAPRPWGRACLAEHMLRTRGESAAPRAPERVTRAATDDEDAFAALLESLRKHDGNLSHAVAALGVTRARAYRLFAAHPEHDLSSLRKGLRS